MVWEYLWIQLLTIGFFAAVHVKSGSLLQVFLLPRMNRKGFILYNFRGFLKRFFFLSSKDCVIVGFIYYKTVGNTTMPWFMLSCYHVYLKSHFCLLFVSGAVSGRKSKARWSKFNCLRIGWRNSWLISVALSNLRNCEVLVWRVMLKTESKEPPFDKDHAWLHVLIRAEDIIQTLCNMQCWILDSLALVISLKHQCLPTGRDSLIFTCRVSRQNSLTAGDVITQLTNWLWID